MAGRITETRIDHSNMKHYQSPCYIIHEEKLKSNIAAFRNAFIKEWGGNICMGYSIKTNHFPWLIQYAYKQGQFAEAVSDDEYFLAINCGVSPEHIILNGPQKGAEALRAAIQAKSIVNLDNLEEITALTELLCKTGVAAQERKALQIGLRVNYDLEAVCPGETTAGNSVSRFGFCKENGELERAIGLLHRQGLAVSGLHMHYSTKTRSGAVFSALAREACEIAKEYHLEDEIHFIDIGGGFFGGRRSDLHPAPEGYSHIIASTLKRVFDPGRVKLIIEPGAAVLATAIDYRCSVSSVKQVRGVSVVTLDGTSLHINPFQVKRHPIYTVRKVKDTAPGGKQIVCGNTCMENDRFFETDSESAFSVGDELIFQHAGAYTMALTSCFIHVPPAVYLLDDQSHITCIRKRSGNLMQEN